MFEQSRCFIKRVESKECKQWRTRRTECRIAQVDRLQSYISVRDIPQMKISVLFFPWNYIHWVLLTNWVKWKQEIAHCRHPSYQNNLLYIWYCSFHALKIQPIKGLESSCLCAVSNGYFSTWISRHYLSATTILYNNDQNPLKYVSGDKRTDVTFS